MDPTELPNELRALLHTPGPPGLGPAPRAHVEAVASLGPKLDDLVRALALPSGTAQVVRALVLLWHDHLHAAHELVQAQADPDANLVHAIMHRREPDYGNAKYWFRRVGRHPVFEPLAREATALLERHEQTALAGRLLPQRAWDPLAFVDLCQECAERDAEDELHRCAVALQGAEFVNVARHLVRARYDSGRSTRG